MTRAAQGLRAWLLQRFTAIYLAVFFLYVLFHFVSAPPAGYRQWLGWVAQPVTSIAAMVFVLALLLHAWVGVRDVLIDYVHAVWIRLSLMALVGLLLLGSGLWLFRALILAAMNVGAGGG